MRDQLTIPGIPAVRVCKTCHTELDLESGFYRATRSRGGRMKICKACMKEANARWSRANPERGRAAAVRWYEAHKEQGRAKTAAYRKANREKVKETLREWRRRNPDYKPDPEKRAAAVAKYGQQPHVRAARAARQLVRGRKLRAQPIDPLVVLEMSDSCCGICGMDIVGEFHVDHVIPIARGGWHGLDNVQAAHPICNIRKGDRL